MKGYESKEMDKDYVGANNESDILRIIGELNSECYAST